MKKRKLHLAKYVATIYLALLAVGVTAQAFPISSRSIQFLVNLSIATLIMVGLRPWYHPIVSADV